MMMNSTVGLYPHHPYGGYRFESNMNNTPPRFYSTPHHYQQQSSTPPDEIFDDEDQIPSIDEFRAIIDDYLNNLSPKKRDKALVDQHRYYLIQQVLRDPRNTSISTAQFRFWVKKMFQLQPGTTDLVCHDNKPVAMKEQIYDILVKAHREAHHGGRDKTSALVRRRFSWIPKELVARFVRHCPFCITRRNSGHSPSVINSSPHSRYSGGRHGYSFDSTNTGVPTPSSLKEDCNSDISGPPSSSDSGYEATPPNYVTMSSSPSPSRRNYFNSIYDRNDENDFLDCNNSYNFRNNHDSRSNMHPLAHHSQPHSPLFYNQNYSGYPFYSTGYYPNALGITPCQQENNNSNNSTSAAAVAITASNTAAVAAVVAATALMRSPNNNTTTSDLLSHIKQEQHYNNNSSQTNNSHYATSYHQQPLTMPENAYGADI